MRTRRRTIGAGVALLLLWGCTSNPTGTYRQSYEQFDAGTSKRSSVTELMEVGVRGEIGPDFQYAVSDRIFRTDSVIRSQGVTTRENMTQHRISADTVARLGTWTWSQGLELQHDWTQSSIADNALVRTDVLEKLEWAPVDLPRFTTWVNARTQRDDLFVDRSDLETLFQVDETRGPLNYLYSVEFETLQDDRADATRDRVEHVFRAGYFDTTADNQFSLGVNVFVNRRDSETRLPGTGTGPFPGGFVTPRQGLFVIDTTPGSGALNPTPSLIDGDDATSTGINIGGFASGGGLDRNIGLEVPPNTPVDRLLLSTETEVDPFFLPQFAFSLWSSDDNNLWTEVSPGLAFTYERGFRRFNLVFPAVTAPFLKIVNTGNPGIANAVFVTELRAFTPIPGGNTNAQQTDERVETVTATLSWRPEDVFTLTYDVLLGRARRSNAGTTFQDETRTDQGLTANLRTSDETAFTFRGRNENLRDSKRLDQETSLLNGLFEYDPLETLDVALSYTTSKRDRDDGADLDSTAAQVRIAAELLETLQTQLTYEYNVQEDAQGQRTVRRDIYGFALFAELTPDWRFTLDTRHVEATVTGPGSGGFLDPSEESVEGILTYQPNDQITASVELEWQKTSAGSGLDQIYRVDWIPFPDGNLNVQFDVQRQTAGISRNQIDRYEILGRWTIRPTAFVEAQYSHIAPGVGPDVRALTATLNVTF